MSSGPRSSADNYTFPPEPLVAVLNRQGWDETMISIAMRLISLEARDANYEDVVNQLQAQALAVITNSLTEEIENSRAQLAELQLAYDEIAAGGIAADRVTVAAIEGFVPVNVQAAIVELLARIGTVTTALNSQRRITVASLYLGGS